MISQDNDVLIDVIDNTNNITYIDIKPNRKHSDPIDRGEERQRRSVVGSLSWISRQARPDILYRVSKLQRSIKGATIATLHEANKVLEMALKGQKSQVKVPQWTFRLRELGRTNCFRRQLCRRVKGSFATGTNPFLGTSESTH